MCGLCFEIIYRVLLIVQKGHSAPDGQRAALNVRPLQSKRFFLTKPAVQTEGAEYAGAWFYDYIHQNIDLIGKQSLFLFRFSVRGDLDPLSGIINNQVIQTCFLKKLPHSQKNLTLQAFRSGCNTSHMLFVVDEASGVADPILDAIGGTLTGANNRLLYCGNPTKATGGFAESFQGDGMDWYCMTVSSRDSPRTSKENIAALEKKYGKNSNVVRVRVDGLPPVADSDVFIPSYIAEKATMNEPLPHDSPVRLSIGCDVARFGDDCTVIAPNIDADVQELKIRNGQDLWATAEDIIFEYLFLLEKYPQYPGMVYAIIDDTGLGGGVTDILRHEREARGLNQLEVIPVNFGASVPQEDAAANYADISTWMWSLVRDMAQSGRLHLPNDTELIAQLSTRKYAFAGTPPKLKLESKDIMKRRGLPSPDRADAVALSLYQPVTYTWEIG